MARKKKQHRPELNNWLERYADSRKLELQFKDYQVKLNDAGFVFMDIWTTGKYFIYKTSYYKLTDEPIPERVGERGNLPRDLKAFGKFLDGIFFPMPVRIMR